MNGNPLAGLREPLAALAAEAKVLPAGGHAEDFLQRFDLDEHYDRIAAGRDRVVSDICERNPKAVYLAAPARHRRDDHFFRLFVDGATRITFLGTLVDGPRTTPVVLAQLGAAALERADDGRLRVSRRDVRLALVVDRSSLTDRVWTTVTDLAAAAGIHVVDSREETSYTDDTAYGNVVEPRSRAAHVANWHMRVLEKTLLLDVIAGRAEDAWVVLDGSLGKEFWDAKKPDGYVGVVKNFAKDYLFELPGARGATKRVDLHTLIARLDVAHRTAVFRRQDARAAFWYVRLRGPKELDYPLMGVIKVEVPLAAGEVLEPELVDRLSSCLVAERTVAAPTRDPRWHAHLYPIHLAERAIRAAFVSHAVLQAAVKWPRPRLEEAEE